MLGHIRYSEPWVHFARTINEYVLYVIRDGRIIATTEKKQSLYI